MSELYDAVREIIDELDPDGGGFRTSEASDRLYLRAETEAGPLPPITAALAKLGCRVAIRDPRVGRPAMSRSVYAAAAASTSPQYDMADLAEDFGWLDLHTALEEGETAVRKRISHLTLPETLQVIALKRRKAAQAAAMADRLRMVVDMHPEWQRRPQLTLGDIVGLPER